MRADLETQSTDRNTLLFFLLFKVAGRRPPHRTALHGVSSERTRLPVNAFCGQMSTQAVQLPHRGSIGTPVGFSGASVSTVTQRTRGP